MDNHQQKQDPCALPGEREECGALLVVCKAVSTISPWTAVCYATTRWQCWVTRGSEKAGHLQAPALEGEKASRGNLWSGNVWDFPPWQEESVLVSHGGLAWAPHASCCKERCTEAKNRGLKQPLLDSRHQTLGN